MYCPACNHPLLGDPAVCPNCGHALRQAEKAPEPSALSQDAPLPYEAAPSPASVGAAEAALDRKVLWAAIFISAPIIALLLSGIAALFRDVPAVMGIISIVSVLFMVLSIVLVPVALVLSIMGLRSVKKSGGALTGRGIAIITLSLSSLIIAGGITAGIIAVSKWDTISQAITEGTKVGTLSGIEKGLAEVEAENRAAGVMNSFGTYFPETLDSAAPNAESGRDNPFFGEVIKPNGLPLKGWKKGEIANEYIFLSDTTTFIYDPKSGTFSEKKK